MTVEDSKASLCGRWCLTINIGLTRGAELPFVAFNLASPHPLLPRRRHCDTSIEHDTKLFAMTRLKTVGRRRPRYAAMSPSDNSAASAPPLPMSSGGGATTSPSVVAPSSARVSRIGGSDRLNYEFGQSKTSWRRMKETESLGVLSCWLRSGSGHGDCTATGWRSPGLAHVPCA